MLQFKKHGNYVISRDGTILIVFKEKTPTFREKKTKYKLHN
jgi:hypothetical protein